MTFDDIPPGTRIFVDANIFIYHFGGQSFECQNLLKRCAQQQLVGYTSTFILAEVLHRLMIAEAIEKNLVSPKTAVQKLAEMPELVKQLVQYNENVSQIAKMGLTISSLTPEIVAASQAVRTRYGLLTNDSLLIASMNELGIVDLASADAGFTSVLGIRVYGPSDL